ncbi:MAG: transposase [Candidatus Omnitrophota bacterium]
MNPKALLLGFLFLFQEGIKAMRELRIYKNETVYYITVRTNNHELLFQDNSDYEFFVEVLKSRKEKYGFKLYAYCLLNNHYHLLIEPLEGANISKIMQALNTSYTLYFNKKYNRTGHLVGGRFESRLLNKDNGLLNETMHIHLNPSDNYRDYQWSSYSEYMGLINTGLIDKEYILSFLCLTDEQAIKNKYSELIAEEANKKEYARQGTARCAPTLQDDNSRVFSFRPRFALSLVLLLVLVQFLMPRKIQQGSNYNNSNGSSLNNNYASLALPKYSGETKPQEKLVWELWKLGPRE